MGVAALGSAQTPWPLSPQIHASQIGFDPSYPKTVVVVDKDASSFHLCQAEPPYDTVLTGALSEAKRWDPSAEKAKVGDFSAYQTAGNYVIFVPGLGASYPFSIQAHSALVVTRASLKGFYFQRASTSLPEAYAGKWARAAGHPDNPVAVHESAATAKRQAGTILNSSKGWYDAGDYGKYTVNSGISCFSLLSAYEHYPELFDTLKTGIPESGNQVPDLLDEVRWNLEWMLTMQDPSGTVYHKLHALSWPGFITPANDVKPRHVIGLSTPGTLDFAAVMAQASRLYEPYDSAFAQQCLKASEKAWNWARLNPTVYYTAGVDGGGDYGDQNALDEFTWAAAELFLSTGKKKYWKAFQSYRGQKPFTAAPGWSEVNTLALISLSLHQDKIVEPKHRERLQKDLLRAAEPSEKLATESAYRVPMDPVDFVWGSNSVPLGRGMVLLASFRATGDSTYLNATVSALDYVLGRNPLGYCYVTGLGERYPLHIHHRPSESDNVVEPVPGLLSGGPWAGAQVRDGCEGYEGNLAATEFSPTKCSYASNEIAINWNAPLVFVAAGLTYYGK